MEVWKEMNEFYGFYSVSNLGRVKRNKRVLKKTNGATLILEERLISLTNNGNGYLALRAYVNNQSKIKYVHRMVYKYFVGELVDGMQINHIDFNRSNNTPSNLEQVTSRQNIHHSRVNRPKTSDYPCVHYFCNKYVGRFYVKSKPVYCGRFENAREAAVAVKAKMEEYGLEYGNHI
jgi:hypothetical protein